jgi:thymidylate kinase
MNIRFIGMYYLDTPLDICYERIQKRKRLYELHSSSNTGAEFGGVTREYLLDLEKAYKEYLESWRTEGLPIVCEASDDPLYLLDHVIRAFSRAEETSLSCPPFRLDSLEEEVEEQ